MKRFVLKFVLITFIFLSGFNAFTQNNGKVRKVVIDAGHGGRDPGALGKKSKEKDIALSIALKTGSYIEKNLPDVEVIYTRKTDKFVELYKRAKIANQNNADLFISIHCNANNSSKIYGTETYVMGLHKSQANLEVAKAENASILKEENISDEYEGFDPNSPEAYIIFTLYQDAFLEQSINIASKVQKQFKERVGLKDRGVLQAGFWVLYKTTMPGILIETGYLSNPKDEKFLNSKDGQVYIASAIYRAFKEYKKEIEAYNKPLQPIVSNVQKKNPDESNKNKNYKDSENKPFDPGLIFCVQIKSSKKEIKLNAKEFKGLEDVRKYFHNGLYKYIIGNEKSLKSANELKKKVKNKGFKDAFVVAFFNGERISMTKAKKLQKK
ncbi:MAG: N-acetylmuramoyl-L-alanine amidase [Bacteroidales bacterium]|nr:N-acetylmuramoyl-L-alanine amidase [Bacteroidales bacterium]